MPKGPTLNAALAPVKVELYTVDDRVRVELDTTRNAGMHDRTLVLPTGTRNIATFGHEKAADLSTVSSAPWGGFEPPTWRLHRTPRFPSGVDYLFAIAL